jgi:hypothetical protein
MKTADPGARVAERYGIRRSPHWRVVARLHLAVQPYCVACGPYLRDRWCSFWFALSLKDEYQPLLFEFGPVHLDART